jgi:hypothetical protein
MCGNMLGGAACPTILDPREELEPGKDSLEPREGSVLGVGDADDASGSHIWYCCCCCRIWLAAAACISNDASKSEMSTKRRFGRWRRTNLLNPRGRFYRCTLRENV